MTESVPIICIPKDGVAAAGLSPAHAKWAEANGFAGESGKLLALPGEGGTVEGYLFGLGEEKDRSPLIVGQAAASLPAATYRLDGEIADPAHAALGFRLGAYRFDRYRKSAESPQLELPAGVDAAALQRLTDAAFIARDLINTPANDLGPDALEDWITAFARERKMEVVVTRGEELLAENFPMIHAVGRASAQAPRLIDLTWGDPAHPKLTLVGKGVTFDTGGLNIKPGNSMALMKKDMGGAANILGLAHAVLDAGLKVRLRVLIPVVENAISGSSFRPGDVLPSRKGLSVEIGNTDAEGRLILADALTLACEERPDLVIDMATLTGAARVALGPELPPIYGHDRALVDAVAAAGLAVDDPVWPMPLWPGYDKMLSSKIADVSHISSGAFAGSVTAALFLNRFIETGTDWLHLDIFGWAPEARPGRPFGGTDQGIRALYEVLAQRYAQ